MILFYSFTAQWTELKALHTQLLSCMSSPTQLLMYVGGYCAPIMHCYQHETGRQSPLPRKAGELMGTNMIVY